MTIAVRTGASGGGLADHDPKVGWAAWFAVVILAVAQIISNVDRGLLALVIDPMRHDLGITDIQIALLQGFAFAIFYVTIGLPLGMVADAVNRRWLLIGGVLVWSAATVGGGLAENFHQMFASRLFIGVGEAVLGPCAVTIIADLFPPDRRGRPMAVYVLGSMVAYGIGSVVAGYILEVAPKGVFEGVAFLHGRAPWRIAFILVGASGLILAGLLLLLREPPRRDNALTKDQGSALRTTASFFSKHAGFLALFYASLATFALGGSVASGWGAALLARVYGYTPALAGRSLGAAQIIWALVGAGVAAIVIDRVAKRYGAGGKLALSAAVALLTIPAAAAAIAPNGAFATILLAEVMFASAVYGSTMLSIITDVMPARSRGISVALYAFVMTMIGYSLGPLGVAYLTQKVFGSPHAVGQSMAIVGTAALLVSAILALCAGRVLLRSRSAGILLTSRTN